MRTVRFRRDGPALPPHPGDLAARAVQPAVGRLVAVLAGRYGGLLDRLAAFGGVSLQLDPTDLPFNLIITFGAAGPSAQVVRRQCAAPGSAVIRAPLYVLLDIAEGRADGDGLFFSRAVSVAGDTGLIVALRNALDDAEVDLAGAVADALGPLGQVLRPGFAAGRDAVRAISRLVSAVAGHG
jgi:predicted lipid carrier protein YhbT